MELLQNPVAPCAFVRQPWTTIVATHSTTHIVRSAVPGRLHPDPDYGAAPEPGGTLRLRQTAVDHHRCYAFHNPQLLQNPVAPCAFVRQPWTTIVATQNNAAAIQASLRTWWPEGNSPGSGWQNTLFNGIVGGANARVFFEDGLPTPLNYTSTIRPIPSIDATSTCQPARRWCTVSAAEHTKCSWVRTAAYSLGIQPTIACQQRAHIFECLNDIKEGRADFVASSSNVGFLARDPQSLANSAPTSSSASTTSKRGERTLLRPVLTSVFWLETAYSLGIQPTIACQQRAHIFECLDDIKEGRADFVASSSNVGFLARE
ncbi:transferrin domain-containing protein [Phthorimaea operculella]|nr:transferrin domain-containing protein [Phthorimaea operculella]